MDAKETVWYRNPEWTKHRMTGSLTKLDHVCVAACDIDHDKRAEVAIGAEWNPGDTVNSGSVNPNVGALGLTKLPSSAWLAVQMLLLLPNVASNFLRSLV